ncbi:unnamed protein product [Blepharisma stoltei]|uniref:Casein kinase substrate phosphoprotein PP28 domain-containing protein n=1 Tax=Blepharisma stoltei TaxID=1481888 RepID=A0AAU9JQ95_9CILI|nr:unnamed protein product [Blepharisma stoltei]
MPRDSKGKNKKWSKHKGKDYGRSKLEKLQELAAKRGVEVWEIDPNEISSGDESEEEEGINEAEEHEEEETKTPQEENKKVEQEDSDEEEDKYEGEVVVGHQGLMEISNPNRARGIPKSWDPPQESGNRRGGYKGQEEGKSKGPKVSKSDKERLEEIRARRDAASKQREENKKKQEKLKEEASNKFKKK